MRLWAHLIPLEYLLPKCKQAIICTPRGGQFARGKWLNNGTEWWRETTSSMVSQIENKWAAPTDRLRVGVKGRGNMGGASANKEKHL